MMVVYLAVFVGKEKEMNRAVVVGWPTVEKIKETVVVGVVVCRQRWLFDGTWVIARRRCLFTADGGQRLMVDRREALRLWV